MGSNTNQQAGTELPATAAPAATQLVAQAAPNPGVAPPRVAGSEHTLAIGVHPSNSPVSVEITKSPTDYTGIVISIGASLVVALVTSFLGYWVIRMQLSRQSRDAQAQQRANTKAQLRLDAYKDIQTSLTKYSDVESPFVRIALIRAELVVAVEAGKEGQYRPLQARFQQFAEKINAFQNRVCELVFCVERYESILPGFDIFKTALSCALHDLRQCRGAFDAVLVHYLPMDGVDHSGRPKLLNAQIMTQEALDHFNTAARPLETAIEQAGGWVFDLGVESQNFSLAEYADKVVPRRKPIDPNFFTVTVEPSDRQELQAKFDDTEYGRWLRETLADAHRG